MVASSPVCCFLATADPDRARAFYAGTLGLSLTAEDDFALIFDLNGVMLRVQKVSEVVAPPYTTIGWNVDDIESTVEDLTAKGISFERYPFLEQAGNGIWTAPGGPRIAWFKDPAGHTLSLAQHV